MSASQVDRSSLRADIEELLAWQPYPWIGAYDKMRRVCRGAIALLDLLDTLERQMAACSECERRDRDPRPGRGEE